MPLVPPLDAPPLAVVKRPCLEGWPRSGSVQICWKKFARYWDIEMRELEMLTGELCISPERVIEAVDENTIFVVPTLGVTYHGLYEDIESISKALDDLQARTGLMCRFTWMRPVVAFLLRSAHRISPCGTFAWNA